MKLSVIVPFYNVEKYIEKSAVSLLNQTYQDMEIIFIDDGSQDNSLRILEKTIDKYPDKKCRIISKKNAGLPQARKTGVENSKGEYIAFVDSDDWLDIDFYTNCMKYVIRNDCEVYNTGYTIDYLGGKTEEKSKAKRFHIISSEKFVQLLHDRVIFHSMWSKVFKKNVFDKIVFPKGNFVGEDYATIIPLMRYIDKVGVIPEGGYHYRILEQSMGHGGFNSSKKKGFYNFNKLFPLVSEWFPNCKDTIIGFHAVEYMAAVISMGRNNTYNKEIITKTRKFLLFNYFVLIRLKKLDTKYKISVIPMIICPFLFLKTYLNIQRIVG